MPARNSSKSSPNNGKTSGKSSSSNANSWKGFVQCELTDAQKQAAKMWIQQNSDDVFPLFFSLVDDSFKVSISFDYYNNSYVASATCREPKLPANGWTLSGRGGTVFNAVASLMFKHLVVFADGWVLSDGSGGRQFNPDDIG